MVSPVDFEKLALQPIEHLGIVAGLIQKYNLVNLLDNKLPVSKEKGSIVTHGQRVAAMIINGLGFTAKPLYLSPDFFENKPVSRLIGEVIEAKHLNDDALIVYALDPSTTCPKALSMFAGSDFRMTVI